MKKLLGITLGVSVVFLMVIKYQIILLLKLRVLCCLLDCIFGSQPVRVSEVEHSRKEGL